MIEFTSKELAALWWLATNLLTYGVVKLAALDEEDVALLKRLQEEI